MEELRIRIAQRDCPINVGDTVQVSEDGREFSFVVELITYHLDMDVMTGETLVPVVSAKTGWAHLDQKFESRTLSPVSIAMRSTVLNSALKMTGGYLDQRGSRRISGLEISMKAELACIALFRHITATQHGCLIQTDQSVGAAKFLDYRLS